MNTVYQTTSSSLQKASSTWLHESLSLHTIFDRNLKNLAVCRVLKAVDVFSYFTRGVHKVTNHAVSLSAVSLLLRLFLLNGVSTVQIKR
jgi:hypothetical protein